MNVVVVPVKELSVAKSRLRPVLGDAGRERLAWAMAEHVVRQAVASPRVQRVIVVSADARVLERVRDLGAVALVERPAHLAGGSLNQALDQARRSACEALAVALAVVVSDLPFLEAEDVSQLFDELEGERCAVLAPAHDGIGLGALALKPPDALPFRFGEGVAFRHHAGEAAAANLRVRRLERRGLAFDLDTPADLAALDTERLIRAASSLA